MRYSFTKKYDKELWGVLDAESPLDAIAQFDKAIRNREWYVTGVWMEQNNEGVIHWIATVEGQKDSVGFAHYVVNNTME